MIAENIREMVAAGHPHRQAVAAALHNADKGGHMAHERGRRHGHEHEGHEASIFKGLHHSGMHGRDDHEKEPSPGGHHRNGGGESGVRKIEKEGREIPKAH